MSAIPLKDFSPGNYTLVVAVTDQVVPKTVTAEMAFQVR
jgi:tRNA A37 threonylcarbamoyladenosine synthetase subunit TsaC/SUA5/YrdC